MARTLTVYENVNGENVLLTVEGWLDAENTPRLQERVEKLGAKARRMTFDFSELKYISSSGLRVLITAIKLLEPRHGKVAISRISPDIREVFEMSGLLDQFVQDEKHVMIEKRESPTEMRLLIGGDIDMSTFISLRLKLSEYESMGIKHIIIEKQENTKLCPEAENFFQEKKQLADQGVTLEF
jgi:anti-sigma B factor antagonist